MKDVGQALYALEAVADRVGRSQESVLAHVELHARVEQEGDYLTRSVTGERDAARAAGLSDDVGHAPERALHAPAQGVDAQGDAFVFPQHGVVLEDDAVTGTEVD